MPSPSLSPFACLAAALLALTAQAGDGVDGYLTKDGKLAGTLEVRDLMGGFAGVTGTYYNVQPDGKWSTGKVFQAKLTEVRRGMLAKDDLAKLAKNLAHFELLGLKTTGKLLTNPRVVTIKFGKWDATLNLATGAILPKVDSEIRNDSPEPGRPRRVLLFQ